MAPCSSFEACHCHSHPTALHTTRSCTLRSLLGKPDWTGWTGLQPVRILSAARRVGSGSGGDHCDCRCPSAVQRSEVHAQPPARAHTSQQRMEGHGEAATTSNSRSSNNRRTIRRPSLRAQSVTAETARHEGQPSRIPASIPPQQCIVQCVQIRLRSAFVSTWPSRRTAPQAAPLRSAHPAQRLFLRRRVGHGGVRIRCADCGGCGSDNGGGSSCGQQQ